MILIISIVAFVLALVAFYLMYKGKELKVYFFGETLTAYKPTHILSLSMMFGLIVFTVLYLLNGYNVNYISEYMDYTSIEPIDKCDLYGEDIYELYLVYDDKSKIKVVFTYDNPKAYENQAKIALYLTDYNGKTLYSIWRETDTSTVNRFKKMIVDDNIDIWQKFEKNRK